MAEKTRKIIKMIVTLYII